MTAQIVDTYAEAFRSLYAEVLVTARDRFWLDQAIREATGHASSTIMCDCEAGVDHFVGPGTPLDSPDGRVGAVLQFHVPRFRKDRVEALERALLGRVSQNVLTTPTTCCFNTGEAEGDYYRLGRKVAYFGDGHERLVDHAGRRMWWIPTMGGAFLIDRRFPYHDGIMGGNLWFLGHTEEAAIDAARGAAQAVAAVPGAVTPFPGGVAASASKAGSKYAFLFASTYAEFCPQLKEELGERSQVPAGVTSIMEIIINGRDLETVRAATYAAIDAVKETPGLASISAGNYGGRLGKSFIHLRRPSAEA